jgi:hypothetical protein
MNHSSSPGSPPAPNGADSDTTMESNSNHSSNPDLPPAPSNTDCGSDVMESIENYPSDAGSAPTPMSTGSDAMESTENDSSNPNLSPTPMSSESDASSMAYSSPTVQPLGVNGTHSNSRDYIRYYALVYRNRDRFLRPGRRPKPKRVTIRSPPHPQADQIYRDESYDSTLDHDDYAAVAGDTFRLHDATVKGYIHSCVGCDRPKDPNNPSSITLLHVLADVSKNPEGVVSISDVVVGVCRRAGLCEAIFYVVMMHRWGEKPGWLRTGSETEDALRRLTLLTSYQLGGNQSCHHTSSFAGTASKRRKKCGGGIILHSTMTVRSAV